ncbi:MAG: redoxin family protein [Acidobacteria bacterium]|nr:redoxin family protein [Acidobacteriota bacterium]
MLGMIRFVSGIFVLAFLAIGGPAQKDIAPDAVKTTILDADGLRALVRDSDKPLLVNFWATWCGPCRAEFPELVKIDNEFRAKGLTFALVSIDNVSLADTAVSDFLKSYEAKMPSYLLDLEDRRKITRSIRRIAPRYSGGFPVTMLYDSAGKLVYLKHGVVNGQVLRRRIEKVLRK